MNYGKMFEQHNHKTRRCIDMPRQKKDAKILNIKLASSVNEQLEQFCAETGLNKTTATEKIMANFFEDYFKKDFSDRCIFK